MDHRGGLGLASTQAATQRRAVMAVSPVSVQPSPSCTRHFGSGPPRYRTANHTHGAFFILILE